MRELPLSVRRSIEVVGLCALGAIVVLGQTVIMPLLLALFLSILLLPSLRWFIRHRIPESLSIILCIGMLLLFTGGITVLLSWQIGTFLKDTQTIQDNLTQHWNDLSKWISSKTHYSMAQQLAIIRQQGSKMGSNVMGRLQSTMVSLSSIFIFLGLLPIYVFLILYYRNLLLRFIFMWFAEAQHNNVKSAIRETEVMVKSYLLGLLIQIAYLTVLLGGILLLFGIKHAILIGITFAILNLIPYLGALIGNGVGVLLTLSTSQSPWQIWAVLGTIAFVQFLDNNILMPRIVGSKVKVNALAGIVGIVTGGVIAGISGMFLSIPVMALLKIVFDRSVALKQWGVLLGDDVPRLSPISNRIFRVKHLPGESRDKEAASKLNKHPEKE